MRGIGKTVADPDGYYLRTADHGAKLHELPDEHLVELLPIVKKIAVAVGADNYNVLQVSFPGESRWVAVGGVAVRCERRGV